MLKNLEWSSTSPRHNEHSPVYMLPCAFEHHENLAIGSPLRSKSTDALCVRFIFLLIGVLANVLDVSGIFGSSSILLRVRDTFHFRLKFWITLIVFHLTVFLYKTTAIIYIYYK